MKSRKATGQSRWGRILALVAGSAVLLPVLLVVGAVLGLRYGISDAQKARWATQALAEVIPARIGLGGLHWEMPAAVTLTDVDIRDPQADKDAAPLVTAKKVQAKLWLAALSEHRIALMDVHVEDANVTMTQKDTDGDFDLAAAFVPPPGSGDPRADDPAQPWMVSLDDIALERVNFTLTRPDLRLVIREAALDKGAFWIRGESIGVSAALRTAVAMRAGDTRLHITDLGVTVEDGVWRMREDDVDIGVKRIRVEAQNNTVDATGHFRWSQEALREVDAKVDVQLDTAAELLQGQLPKKLQKTLHGKAMVQATLKGDYNSVDYALDVGALPQTPALLLGYSTIDALHLTGSYARPTLTVTKLELHSGDARMEAQGHVAVTPRTPVRLGAHVLHIKGHAIPLARTLEPFTGNSSMSPGQVDLELDSKGEGLWPPHNTAALRMSVRGIPKKLIGVPDPLEIDSAFAGHGDRVRIEHFHLRGEDTDFALQGDIPLAPDGVLDVLSQLKQVKAGKTLKRLKVPLGAREVRLRTRLTGTFAHPRAEGELWADDVTAQDRVMQVHAPFSLEDTTLTLNHAELRLQDGKADVSGAVTFAEHPELALRAELQNVAAAASGLPLSGDIDGAVSARGPIASPVAQCRITWHDAGLRQGGARAEVSLLAQSDTRGMHVEKLEVVPVGGGYSRMQGDVRWDTQHIDVNWEAADIAADWLARIAAPHPGVDLKGTLQARGHAGGTPADVVGEANITLKQVSVAAADLGDVVIALRADPREVKATVAVDPKRSHVNLETTLVLATAEHPMRATGKAHIAPVWVGDFFPDLVAQATDAKVAADGQFSWNPQAGLHASVELAQLDAHVGKKTVSLERPAHVRWKGGEASVDDLHLRGDLAALWLRGRWGKEIRAQADGHLDLRVLSDFVPALGSADGTLEVALRVDGTAKHPDPHGKLRVTSPVVMRLRQVPGEIYIDRGALTLSPKGVGISDWRGRYGFGALELDGHVGLDGLRPGRYDVRLKASDIPCRTPELLLELSADVHVNGSGMQPMVHGKIDITRGRYIKRFDLHDFYVQAKPGPTGVALKDKAPALEGVGLDVHVGTSNELVVNVDAGIFAVKTDLQANLHITGNPVYPKINGSLHAEGGTLKFPEASLNLTDANLDFTPSAGHAIDAKVHMLGEGTVTSSGANSQTYAVTLQLDGDLDKMQLDLRATPDRTRLEVLSLLTTGHADLSELVQQSSDDNKLNAALVFAGSQVSEPVTRYAAAQIERYAKLKVDLGAQVTQDAVTLTASKQVMSRLRLQGAYQHGIGTDNAAVVAGAQVALTDQVFFEGTQTVPTTNANTVDNYAQGSLQLKWRLLGH